MHGQAGSDTPAVLFKHLRGIILQIYNFFTSPQNISDAYLLYSSPLDFQTYAVSYFFWRLYKNADFSLFDFQHFICIIFFNSR